jgi:hypothetical protein
MEIQKGEIWQRYYDGKNYMVLVEHYAGRVCIIPKDHLVDYKFVLRKTPVQLRREFVKIEEVK